MRGTPTPRRPSFWLHGDRIDADHWKESPLEAGLFDESRLEP